MEDFTFRTQLWERSENSAATTIPQPIRAARGIPADADVEVVWEITEDGDITVEFEQQEDDE